MVPVAEPDYTNAALLCNQLKVSECGQLFPVEGGPWMGLLNQAFGCSARVRPWGHNSRNPISAIRIRAMMESALAKGCLVTMS